MVGLVLLAYAIGLLLGEAVRDRMYGEGGDGAGGQDQSLGKRGPGGRRGKRWRLYNGVIEGFRRLVYGLVRS